MQDVDAVDLVDLSDAVLKVKDGRVVDGHLELGEGAEDLHLRRDVKVTAVTLIRVFNRTHFYRMTLGGAITF